MQECPFSIVDAIPGGPSDTFESVRSRLHDGDGHRYTMDSAGDESSVPGRKACGKFVDGGHSSGVLSDSYEDDGDSSCNSTWNELGEQA